MIEPDPNGDCPDCGEQLRDGVCAFCPDPDDGPSDSQMFTSEPAEAMTIFDKDTLGRGGLG